jgi:hypothetical protein
MDSGATLGDGRVSRAESDSSDGLAGAADGTAEEMRADTRRRDALATRSLMAVFSAGAESRLDLLRRFPSCFNMSLRAMGLVFDSLYGLRASTFPTCVPSGQDREATPGSQAKSGEDP